MCCLGIRKAVENSNLSESVSISSYETTYLMYKDQRITCLVKHPRATASALRHFVKSKNSKFGLFASVSDEPHIAPDESDG